MSDNKQEVLGKCPLCDGDIIEKERSYTCSNAKWKQVEDESWENVGCKFQIWKNSLQKFGGKEIDAKLLKELLEKKEIEVEFVSRKKVKIDEKYGVKIIFSN